MADDDVSDTIKMFIGQISKSMDEDELRTMLEEFGPVLNLNILKDRSTGLSKGCAFAVFSKQKDAHAAQTALNNIKFMPGMSHPVQIKPAEGQAFTFEERKVFVGMLSKNLSESDVSTMFAPFGQIEDCSVLKDLDGNSKGCAFISFTTRQGALNAIKSMHHSQTLKGCRLPLVVKFADTQKDKEAKKHSGRIFTGGSGMAASMCGPGGPGMNYGGGAGGFGNNNYGMMQQQNMQQYQSQGPAFGSNSAAMNPFAAMLGNSGGCVNPLQQLLAATASAAPMLAANPALATLFAAIVSNTAGVGNNNNTGAGNNFNMMQQQQGFAAQQQQQPSVCSGNGMSGMSQSVQMQDNSSNMSSNQMNPSSPPSNAYNATSIPGFVSGGVMNPGNAQTSGTTSSSGGVSTSSIPLPQYGPYGNKLPDAGSGNQSSTSGWSAGDCRGHGAVTGGGGVSGEMLTKAYTGFQQFLTSMTASNSVDTSGIAGSQEEGPEGANLFIYHLPQEFRDNDLIQMFLPFGKVISAKVFIDKVTGSSKCFGFVSYDDPEAAQTAIQSMNGANLGSRRLKVSIKTSKSEKKPYERSS